jgi:hypothetical protein
LPLSRQTDLLEDCGVGELVVAREEHDLGDHFRGARVVVGEGQRDPAAVLGAVNRPGESEGLHLLRWIELWGERASTRTTTRSDLAHEPLDGAAGDRDAFAVER